MGQDYLAIVKKNIDVQTISNKLQAGQVGVAHREPVGVVIADLTRLGLFCSTLMWSFCTMTSLLCVRTYARYRHQRVTCTRYVLLVCVCVCVSAMRSCMVYWVVGSAVWVKRCVRNVLGCVHIDAIYSTRTLCNTH